MTLEVELHDTRPTFEDVAEALGVIRERDDDNRWQAGDLVKAWMDQVERGQRKAELKRLSDVSSYTYAGLRERYDCSVYWPVDARNWDLAWSYYNRARRGADLPEAIDRMTHAEMNGVGIDEFADYCACRLEVPTKSSFKDALLLVVSALVDLTARNDIPKGAKPLIETAVKALRNVLDKSARVEPVEERVSE